jgi:hypothetical protein
MSRLNAALLCQMINQRQNCEVHHTMWVCCRPCPCSICRKYCELRVLHISLTVHDSNAPKSQGVRVFRVMIGGKEAPSLTCMSAEVTLPAERLPIVPVPSVSKALARAKACIARGCVPIIVAIACASHGVGNHAHNIPRLLWRFSASSSPHSSAPALAHRPKLHSIFELQPLRGSHVEAKVQQINISHVVMVAATRLGVHSRSPSN